MVSLFDLLDYSNTSYDEDGIVGQFVNTTKPKDDEVLYDMIMDFAADKAPLGTGSIFSTVQELECYGIVEEIIREQGIEDGLLIAMQRGISRCYEEDMLDVADEIGVGFLEKMLKETYVPDAEEMEDKVREYLSDNFEYSYVYSVAERMVNKQLKFEKLVKYYNDFLDEMECELNIHVVNHRRDANRDSNKSRAR